MQIMQAGVRLHTSQIAAHAKVQNWFNTTEVDYMQHDICIRMLDVDLPQNLLNSWSDRVVRWCMLSLHLSAHATWRCL